MSCEKTGVRILYIPDFVNQMLNILQDLIVSQLEVVNDVNEQRVIHPSALKSVALLVASFLHMNDEDYLKTFLTAVPWVNEKSFFGHPPCRKKMWYGDFVYHYSGTSMPVNTNMPDGLQEMINCAQVVSEKVGQPVHYHGVLMNLYEDGQHSISWHSDNEKDLKPGAPIFSISLGAERVFKMRPITKQFLDRKLAVPKPVSLVCKSGSAVIMGGTCQQWWQHAVEKDAEVEDPRINFTLRQYVGQR